MGNGSVMPHTDSVRIRIRTTYTYQGLTTINTYLVRFLLVKFSILVRLLSWVVVFRMHPRCYKQYSSRFHHHRSWS